VRRFCAVAAPAFLLGYGVLRWVDGLDGHRKGGPAWDVGHVAFLIAIVLFAVLAVSLQRSVRDHAPDRRWLAAAALVATLVGAACFLWVILGDLVPDLQRAAPLPAPLDPAGPALFMLGLLALLVLLVLARLLPVWSPVSVLLGFAALTVALDLLPVGAVLIGAGLLPLALGRNEHGGEPPNAPAATRDGRRRHY
jgi:hypothetical protein